MAWAEVYGYTNVQLNKIEDVIKDYDVIVNTIPHIILQGDILQKINKDTLLLDLASGEGGINKEEAQENKINLIKALGIPGKISPITTAKILKETIYEILEEKK